jgi:hypothetical protein
MASSIPAAAEAAAATASTERENLLRQQLSSKDEVIAELRASKVALDESHRAVTKSKDAVIHSKDALIEAKNKLLVKIQESLVQQPASPSGSSANTALTERLAAAEARLQQLESVCGASGGERSSLALSDREQKRARYAPECTLSLEKDEVLDDIFSFVGRKEWLYAGGVCRQWRGRYLSMCYKGRADEDEHAFQTSHRSSFATAARFEMALENGLEMPDEGEAGRFFYDLPKISQQPIEVLTLARVRGAAWHRCYCRDAAFYGDLQLLKWLRKSGCPWDVADVAGHTIRSIGQQRKLILHWLLSVKKRLSQKDKNALLVEAGIENSIAAAELLLANGNRVA